VVNTPEVRPDLAGQPPEITRGMPFAAAVAYFGLAAVKRLGTRQQRANWRHREGFIPWEYLVALLFARIPSGTDVALLWAPSLTEVTQPMVPQWNDAARDLVKVLRDLKEDDALRVAALAALKAGAEKADARPARRRAQAGGTTPGRGAP